MIRSLGSAGLALVTLAAGLGLYLVSYSVGAERSGIAKLERQIATDRRDIRALEAELRARIEAGVADGSISQEKADWLLEGLDKGFLDGGFGFGHGGHHDGQPPVDGAQPTQTTNQ